MVKINFNFGRKLGKCHLTMTNARWWILGKRILKKNTKWIWDKKTIVERDLGIMIAKDLKWVHQKEKALQAAKALQSHIINSFTDFDAELVRLLYVSLIRPHMKYAVLVWNPYLRGGIENKENVKQRQQDLFQASNGRECEYRLNALKLATLETRRKRGPILIQFYKSKKNWIMSNGLINY